MASIELEIPSRSVYVGVVRMAVASLARDAGLDEERVDDLRIAVSEACANALAGPSANGDGPPPITVTWQEDDARVVVEVTDRASNLYDPASPALEGDTAQDRLSLSIELLRSLVDECDIQTEEDGGTLTRLVIRR